MVAGSVAILAPAPPVGAAGQIEAFKSGLTFPIALAFSSDGRIFYAEKDTGSIRIIYLANRTLLPTPFYTLPNTQNTDERGLLGLALDPGFPATSYVYAYQTYNDLVNGTVYNRIVRILASGNTGVSHTVILRMPPLGATIHNGGVIAFGPDGKLYAVVGENGIQARSQDPLGPMGKVLRMNSNGSAPPDNPFYGNPAWYNLTYTYGHRNMFGLVFHPITGRVYVTENGPNCNDEINLLPNLTGLDRNYGWGPTASCGSLPPPADTNQDGPNPVLPIWWWGTTICPTNAAIYKGPSFPKWQGDLFMGECNPPYRFHRLHLVPPGYDSVGSDDILWTAPTSIIEVEQGRDGAIWLTTPTTIYRYWDSGKPPIASFTATPNPVIEGATVAFNASGSSDPDGTIDSYLWDFGDLTNGSGAIISHSYQTFGTFNVTLTVTDNESFTATAHRDVVVHAPPVASFTATPNPVVAGASVTFDASASHDPDGNIVNHTWDFGDSTFGNGAITSHPYASAGTYSVTLNVTDNDSLNGTVYHDVVVRPPPPGPRPPVTVFVGLWGRIPRERGPSVAWIREERNLRDCAHGRGQPRALEPHDAGHRGPGPGASDYIEQPGSRPSNCRRRGDAHVHRHRVGSRRGRAVVHVESRRDRHGRKHERARLRIRKHRRAHGERHRVRRPARRLPRMGGDGCRERGPRLRHVLAVLRVHTRRPRGDPARMARPAKAKAGSAASLTASRKIGPFRAPLPGRRREGERSWLPWATPFT